MLSFLYQKNKENKIIRGEWGEMGREMGGKWGQTTSDPLGQVLSCASVMPALLQVISQ
jgi:hypothetical protein